MSGAHTHGRLAVCANGDANSYALLDDTGNWLMSLLHNGQQVTHQQVANMERMTACWNACESLDLAQINDLARALNQHKALLDFVTEVATTTACGNSDPDVMGQALDDIVATAQVLLAKRKNAHG